MRSLEEALNNSKSENGVKKLFSGELASMIIEGSKFLGDERNHTRAAISEFLKPFKTSEDFKTVVAGVFCTYIYIMKESGCNFTEDNILNYLAMGMFSITAKDNLEQGINPYDMYQIH